MIHINDACIPVLVTEASKEKNDDAIWTVIKAAPFYNENRKDTPIRIVMHDIVTARKSQGLAPGDILLVWGKLSYYADLGMTLYCNSFLVVSKTEDEDDLTHREFVCGAYTNIPAHIVLQGKINNVAGDTVILKVKRNTPVRGEIKDYDILPIAINNPSNYKNFDQAIFVGNIQNGKLIGTLTNLSKGKS